jgi:hypothetical protein
MAKKLIRLTESDLHRIVNESVQHILKEMIGGTYNSVSDDEWLSGADDEDDYNNRESSLLDRQFYKGEDAMDYHPQRNRSTLMGDDFASSYAKYPMFNDKDKIDSVTKYPRERFGFN